MAHIFNQHQSIEEMGWTIIELEKNWVKVGTNNIDNSTNWS